MSTIYKHLFISLAGLFLALVWSVSSFASSLGVQPLFLEVRPNQSAALRVSNSADTEVSVEITVEKRVVDENGIQKRIPADDDFIIFPPQGVLKPSSVQVFRLQPLETGSVASESYYVTVQQVPVDFSKIPGSGTQIQVVFAFDSAVHVVPRGVTSDPEILSTQMGRTTVSVPTGEFENGSDGTPREVFQTKNVPAVAIQLRNNGNKYLYLQDLEYSVTGKSSDGSPADFPQWSRDEVLSAVNVVLVAPGATRNISLPLPEGFNATDLSTKVKELSNL